jgi:hypothetical protein
METEILVWISLIFSATRHKQNWTLSELPVMSLNLKRPKATVARYKQAVKDGRK